MAARKDNKGRAHRKGEFQRASNGKYETREASDTINYTFDSNIEPCCLRGNTYQK